MTKTTYCSASRSSIKARIKSFLHSVNYWNSFWVLAVPAFGLYLSLSTPLLYKTLTWSIIYYYITGLGITAGYHRLWSHRSYNASVVLRVILAITSAGAIQDSIRTWSADHRAHHRWTDTSLDPYSVRKGLFYSHIGWLIFKQPPVQSTKPRPSVSDLDRDDVVVWQHRYYIPLALFMGYLFPSLISQALWNDGKGGFVYAGILRVFAVQQCTFCVNSLAHYLGDATFSDINSPRDHVVTALLTLGEGYHNFHHEFPSDYRNAVMWWQYDPTKWLIAGSKSIGLASDLKTFNQNVIERGKLQQEVKALRHQLGDSSLELHASRLWTWDGFQEEVMEKARKLTVIAGCVYEVEKFTKIHPGGEMLLLMAVGKDSTALFNGGVYNHSNDARNILKGLKIGILRGGGEVEIWKRNFKEV